MVNIDIIKLSFSLCVVLKMPDIFDFQVFCTDGKREWRAACKKEDLQECVEMGLRAFD